MTRILILITGMSGSGKTTLANFFNKKGFNVIKMGDIIRNLAEQLVLEPTPNELGKLAKQIRKEGGKAAVAIECLKILKNEPTGKAVIDGIRSLDEVDTFRTGFNVILVAVHASPKTRFERLKLRGRSDDTDDFEKFVVRDRRELVFGLGDAIAMSDIMIVNESGFKELQEKMNQVLELLVEK